MNEYSEFNTAGMPSQPTIAVTHPQLPDIDVKLKSNPGKTYALTFAFADLPGNIENVSVTADYVVDNLECVPPQPVSGARLRPEHSLRLSLHKVDAHRYAAELHPDALQDEEYFGLGVCRWSLNWATLRFDSPSTHFVGAISVDQIESGKPLTLHYLASDYRNRPDPEVAVFGEEDDIFAASAGPRFTLAITAKEVAQ